MGCLNEYIKRSDVEYFLFLRCDLPDYMGDAMTTMVFLIFIQLTLIYMTLNQILGVLK